MPTRSFAITADEKPVTLRNAAGEIAVTVSNMTSRPVRGTAAVVPLGGTKKEWLEVAGEIERGFSANEAHQFIVRMAVPAGTPPGRYSCRLNMSSVQNPDDDFTEGPVLSFQLAETTEVVAGGTARPKWPLWALLAVLVAGGGGIAYWIFGGGPDLEAAFSATPAQGFAPLNVSFANSTTGQPDELRWIFGDGDEVLWQRASGGAPAADTIEHAYDRPGRYTAMLLASDGKRSSQTTQDVHILERVSADFLATPASGPPPLTVTFLNQSSGDDATWLWDFGNGKTSKERNPPAQTYSTLGRFSIHLTVAGPGVSGGPANVSTKSVTVEVVASTGAAFSVSPSSGERPLAVAFTDRSAGNPRTWNWDFGDGTTSTERNPKHTYSKTDNYTVTLRVTGPGGTDSVTKTGVVVVREPIRTVPNVVKMKLAEAQKRITQAGLAVGKVETVRMGFVSLGGIVMEQGPSAGKRVVAGTKVNLKVIQ